MNCGPISAAIHPTSPMRQIPRGPCCLWGPLDSINQHSTVKARPGPFLFVALTEPGTAVEEWGKPRRGDFRGRAPIHGRAAIQPADLRLELRPDRREGPLV